MCTLKSYIPLSPSSFLNQSSYFPVYLPEIVPIMLAVYTWEHGLKTLLYVSKISQHLSFLTSIESGCILKDYTELY
jgi:hypothetical protein